MRQEGVPVDALVGGSKGDISVQLPEDDVKALHEQALCVVLVDD